MTPQGKNGTSLIERYGPPPGLAKVLMHGIVPGGVTPEEVLALLGEDLFDVLAKGDCVISTTHTLPTGDVAQVPAYYMLLRSSLT